MTRTLAIRFGAAVFIGAAALQLTACGSSTIKPDGAAQSVVDLVITELAMPEQDGFETIKLLRRRRPGLKIIAMSGRFADLLNVAKILGAEENQFRRMSC